MELEGREEEREGERGERVLPSILIQFTQGIDP